MSDESEFHVDKEPARIHFEMNDFKPQVVRDKSLHWNNKCLGVLGALAVIAVTLGLTMIRTKLLNKRKKPADADYLYIGALITQVSPVHYIVLFICIFLLVSGLIVDRYNNTLRKKVPPKQRPSKEKKPGKQLNNKKKKK